MLRRPNELQSPLVWRLQRTRIQMTASLDTHSERLVQRVNELYHDFFNEQYQYSHPEIFEQENDRWRQIANRFLKYREPATVVDIGTGTGFVPLTIAHLFKREDVFVCCDISRGILAVAERNINKHAFQCAFRFVKIESAVPLRLPFEGSSADVVTINSTLHHIRDTTSFLAEVDRVLRPKGLLLIGHEPNAYFREHRGLWYNYLILSLLTDPTRAVYEVAARTGTLGALRRIYSLVSAKKISELHMCRRLNNQLLKERLISRPLRFEEIGAITDVRDKEGFKPDSLLPNYQLLYLETYNHLQKVITKHYGNWLLRSYDDYLSRKFPHHGSTFFVVARRREG